MLTMLESRLIKDRNKYTPDSRAQFMGGQHDAASFLA